MQSLCILGRQPALGTAELESLLGAEHVVPFGSYVLSDIAAADIPFSRLGGVVKVCEIIGTQDSTDWRALEKTLLQIVPKQADNLNSDGKLHLGLSVYDISVGLKDVEATALRLKKAVRAKTNRSVRVVPNKSLALSTAQILHHKLVSDSGLEIVLVRHDSSVHVALTVHEQNIEAYARRDQNRPKRDARVGMLPPKLAQVIVNLATANNNPFYGPVVLDPFCGTGVILQEATLMGFDVYGSDLEPRMIEYTDKNLMWLLDQPNCPVRRPADASGDTTWRYFKLEQGDATTHTWKPAPQIVACEGYLGQPFSAFPSEAKLRDVMQTCNQIAKGFLKNIATQIPSGTRLCIALPAWQRPNGRFEHLKLLDQIDELGYNRVDLKHVRAEDLLYYRPDQVVARELLVITRK